ncbi:hypothetical protein ACJJIW_09945 [Microbulbifer sp. JMSA004]|uniref:hypothetical protein n=1 Tax=unclassified Microbulbifer TaxID=2619833 RepID=UPI0024AC8C98|nr:hypothetical protein [Microbulbifer sp. VAAF005]WHI45613.1 hypothetical protein P0078_18045 [Microbulbifer sp. VAAF005]
MIKWSLNIEILYTPNSKNYDYNQDAMIVINFEGQLQPQTFEFAFHHLINAHIDLSVFNEYLHRPYQKTGINQEWVEDPNRINGA